MDNPSQIWLNIKAELKNSVETQIYSTWIEPIQCINFDKSAITLKVPNKFFKDWLIEKYGVLLSRYIKNLYGEAFNIVYTYEPETTASQNVTQAIHHITDEKKDEKLSPDELSATYTFDNFVVGPSNRFAHAAFVAVSDSPAKSYNPLFLYGGAGLGKTHLMQASAHLIKKRFTSLKVLYITSEAFTNQLISAIQNRSTEKFRKWYRNIDVLLMDDIQFIAGKNSSQEEFFHTFNALYDDNKQIIVSSDRPPKDISLMEKRLLSRFSWGLVADIQPPNFETRVAILKKKVEGENINIPDEVVFYIAEKIKNNIRELQGALVRVIAYCTLINTKLSVETAKHILKDMFIEEESKINMELIQQKVCDYFSISLNHIKSKKRNKSIVYPRQIAMYLARKLINISLPDIGESFGGRDHTTVMHACDKIEQDLTTDLKLQNTIGVLLNDIKGGNS